MVNRLIKTLTYDKEGVYFAFPFAASNPVLRYEEPAAIVRPDKDFLPGACVSWLTVQHFVELESADAAQRMKESLTPSSRAWIRRLFRLRGS